MDKPEISIIIVTHNSAHEIEVCLNSILRTCPPPTYEIIVIDNNSSDQTVEFIVERWPETKVVAQQTNPGFAKANNQGIVLAQGKFLLFLNPDTIVQPHALSHLVDKMDREPQIGVIAPRLLNVDGSLQSSCREFPRLINNFIGMSEFYRLKWVQNYLGKFFPSLGPHDVATDVDWVVGACFLVRPAVIDEVGPFDESFFMYSEEMEWQYRIKKGGWRVLFSPEAEVIHLGGASSTRYPVQRIIWQYTSLFRFYKLHYSPLKLFMLKGLVWLITIPKIIFLQIKNLRRSEKHPLIDAFWEILWIS